MSTEKALILFHTTVILLFTIHVLLTIYIYYIYKFNHTKSLHTHRNVSKLKEMSPPAIDEKAVVVLSAKNFAHVVAKNRYVMVAFYAPWCYWSRQLDPEYEKAAMELKAELVLAKVDADQETFLANKYAIDGYPTISFFVGGVKVYNYYHERKR